MPETTKELESARSRSLLRRPAAHSLRSGVAVLGPDLMAGRPLSFPTGRPSVLVHALLALPVSCQEEHNPTGEPRWHAPKDGITCTTTMRRRAGGSLVCIQPVYTFRPSPTAAQSRIVCLPVVRRGQWMRMARGQGRSSVDQSPAMSRLHVRRRRCRVMPMHLVLGSSPSSLSIKRVKDAR